MAGLKYMNSMIDQAGLEAALALESFPTGGMYAAYLGGVDTSDMLNPVDLTIVETITNRDKTVSIYRYLVPMKDKTGISTITFPLVVGYKYMTIAFIQVPSVSYSVVEAGGARWKCDKENFMLVTDACLTCELESYNQVYLSVKYTLDMPSPVKEVYSNGKFASDFPVWYMPRWSLSPKDSIHAIGQSEDSQSAKFVTYGGRIRFSMLDCSTIVKIERIDRSVWVEEFAWSMGCVKIRPITAVVLQVSGKSRGQYGVTIDVPLGRGSGKAVPKWFRLTSAGKPLELPNLEVRVEADF